MKNTKLNKKRRLQAFRKWFLTQKDNYNGSNVARCLIGKMIKFTGGEVWEYRENFVSTKGGFYNPDFEEASKYFGFSDTEFASICFDYGRVGNFEKALATLDNIIKSRTESRTSKGLRNLRNFIKENSDVYNQGEPYECVIGIGLRLSGLGKGTLRKVETDNGFMRGGANKTYTEAFAMEYGVTEPEANRIYLGGDKALKYLDELIEKYR